MKSGKISESIYKRSVLKKIKNRRDEVLIGAGIGEDCAILTFEEDQVVSVSSLSAVIYTLEDCVCQLHRVVNKIAASGAKAMGVTLSIVLPESAYESDLKEMTECIEAVCEELEIQILGVHIISTPVVNHPVLTVAGTGKAFKNAYASTKGAIAGQDIVFSKCVGLEGTVRIAAAREQELLERYPSHVVDTGRNMLKELSIVPEAATAIRSGVRTMHAVTDGGIFAALWEIAESSGVGLEIDLQKLPIWQETVELCEFVDINPYQMISTGALLMVADNGYDLVRALEKDRIQACVIGKITDNHDRVVLNEDERRFLERPKSDAIEKLYQI